jgi:DNA-binding NarL/FixJ family response regulator
MSAAKRILFVGEEQPLWEEFRLVSPGPEGGWEAEYAHNEPEALGWIEQRPFTAVVADVHLSDTGGLDVLDEVMRRQSRALRIVLSDLDDTESTIKCVGKGHHHLMKPCDAATLLHALQLAIAMESWLPSAAVQGLISRMRRTPSTSFH